jgi:predicted GIY-YIG superfamily endonuclease
MQPSNDDIYAGSTNALQRRIVSHERSQVASAKAYLRFALKSYVAVQTERNARELE